MSDQKPDDGQITILRSSTSPTTAERANTLFLQAVKAVPGVVHVEASGTEALGEKHFQVYVRDGDLEAERGVYQAKGRVYDCYPDALLSVEVLEQSDLSGENSPGGPSSRCP